MLRQNLASDTRKIVFAFANKLWSSQYPRKGVFRFVNHKGNTT